jgi:hypothetical protein
MTVINRAKRFNLRIISTKRRRAFSHAGAAEVQKAKASVATVKAQKMSDDEMDKVAAGSIYNPASGRPMNHHAWHACFHGPIVCN